MSSNQTAYLDAKGSKLRVAETAIPKAAPNGIVIKNKAIAINPVDWKIQDSGFFIQKWPTVLGSDVAGEVVEVGEQVTRFKKSDRVAAHTIALVTGNTENGGFQHYTAVQADKAAIIPANISFAEGAVFPLALDTAAVGLYGDRDSGFLGLPLPSHSPEASGDVVFVWGGSSSVGAMVIQLAVASGAKVVATAGRHNHERVKSWGASAVIDYNSPSVVDDVVAAVKELKGTFVGTYDAISTGDSYAHAVPIAEKLGGGPFAIVGGPPESKPESLKFGGVFGINDLTHPVWSEFVTKALESGQLKAVPEPSTVGRDLESLQKGVDELRKGVSARKLVIEL